MAFIGKGGRRVGLAKRRLVDQKVKERDKGFLKKEKTLLSTEEKALRAGAKPAKATFQLK